MKLEASASVSTRREIAYRQHSSSQYYKDSWLNFFGRNNIPFQLTQNQRQVFEWRLQVVTCVYGKISMDFKELDKDNYEARVELEVIGEYGLEQVFSSYVEHGRAPGNWTIARMKCLHKFLGECNFYTNKNRSMLVGIDDLADHYAFVSWLAKGFRKEENIPEALELIEKYPDFHTDAVTMCNSTQNSSARELREIVEVIGFNEEAAQFEMTHHLIRQEIETDD